MIEKVIQYMAGFCFACGCLAIGKLTYFILFVGEWKK